MKTLTPDRTRPTYDHAAMRFITYFAETGPFKVSQKDNTVTMAVSEFPGLQAVLDGFAVEHKNLFVQHGSWEAAKRACDQAGFAWRKLIQARSAAAEKPAPLLSPPEPSVPRIDIQVINRRMKTQHARQWCVEFEIPLHARTKNAMQIDQADIPLLETIQRMRKHGLPTEQIRANLDTLRKAREKA